MEGKDFCAGEQWGDHFKRWIFCGGSNEDDGSSLHMGKKSILLSLIESMDLIHKKDRPSLIIFPFLIRLLDDLSDLFHPGEDGTEGKKLSTCGGGNDHR